MQVEQIPEPVLSAALEAVTGEPHIPAKDLHWELKRPCGDCPFLRKTSFHAGVAASLPTYLEAIDGFSFAHTCHKTDNRPKCDGPRDHDGPVQHCAGALIMLLRDRSKWMQSPLVQAIDAGRFDVEGFMDATDSLRPKVHTLRSLQRFYLRELERRRWEGFE